MRRRWRVRLLAYDNNISSEYRCREIRGNLPDVVAEGLEFADILGVEPALRLWLNENTILELPLPKHDTCLDVQVFVDDILCIRNQNAGKT